MRRRIRFFCGIFVGVIAASRLALAAAPTAAPVDIMFAAASDAELKPLLAKLKNSHEESRAAWQFWLGTIGGKQVVLTRTEGDPLNAVAATTLAIRRYAPKLIVTFGRARAHDPLLQSGDLLVSGEFAAFDGLDSIYLPIGDGSDSLSWGKLPHLLATSGEKETRTLFFPAAPSALELAKKLKPSTGKVVVGVLGSAAQVNREADRVAWIRREWGTSSEDGESAHIAGCAKLLGVPVIGLRVIDGEEGDAGEQALHFLEVLP